jgi:hypothetical protein
MTHRCPWSALTGLAEGRLAVEVAESMQGRPATHVKLIHRKG